MTDVTRAPRDIASVITSAISDIQRLSGRDPIVPDDLLIKPIGDLDGFDSYCSIEATVLIGQRLGTTFELESIFISEDGTRALTIDEIVERVATVLRGNPNEQVR
jgi:hypothetical protein